MRRQNTPDPALNPENIRKRFRRISENSEIPLDFEPVRGNEVSFWYLANHIGKRILKDLERRQGRLVPCGGGIWRGELLERFWDGKDVYDDTLTKCIGAIRKALADRQDSPTYIETRYAEGYRYIGPFENSENGGIVIESETRRDVRILIEEEELRQTESHETQTSLIRTPSERSTASFSGPARRVIALAIGLLVVTLSVGAFVVFRTRTRASADATPMRPSSVAVLPLRNLTGDPADEYFSDGVTESLITALSNVQGLKVISRNSVFKFKDKDVDPQDVGQQLGVDALLEGSVSQSGGKIRVESRLVSVRDGSILWANESYKSALNDVLDTQDEIARGVVAGLRLKLNATDQQQLTKRYTANADAYRSYLKGRSLWNLRTPEAMKKAVDQFQQAISLDHNKYLLLAKFVPLYHPRPFLLACIGKREKDG